MFIQDLQKNQYVILQMIHNSEVYEISTTVVGTVEGKALLEPFSYAGQTLDLGNRGFDGVVFHLFLDSPDDKRVCFPNVKIKLIEYKGAKYYGVTSSGSRSMAILSDRRAHKRMAINIPATLTFGINNSKLDVKIHDISDVGIAFTCEHDLHLKGTFCIIDFEDTVKDETFKLNIHAKCVRETQDSSGAHFYGCSVNDASHKMLTYVYILKILSMKK